MKHKIVTIVLALSSLLYSGIAAAEQADEVVYALPDELDLIDTTQCEPETVYNVIKINGVEYYASTPITKTVVLKKRSISRKANAARNSTQRMRNMWRRRLCFNTFNKNSCIKRAARCKCDR